MKIKPNFIIIITFTLIKENICQICQNINELENSQCFNNILYINDSAYRAGHFAKNKNGDIFVEYSSANQRLFYGLYKSGKYYYESKLPFKKKDIININSNGIIYGGRYESTNLFVSTKSDINKEKEYLLGLSSYTTLMEIYDIDNDLMHKFITKEVFINEIYSYQFALFEVTINNENIYFCIYTHDESDNSYSFGNYFSIKKFYFYEDNEHNIKVELIDSSEKFRVKDSRMISGFLGEDQFIYVIFLSEENDISNLSIQKYDYITLQCQESRTLINDIFNKYEGSSFETGIFKSIYLTNNLAAIIYFSSESSLDFRIINLAANYDNKIQKNININIFPGQLPLNDLIKINDERLVFCTANYDRIHFLFIDLYNNYLNIKFRYYLYTSSKYYFEKELSGYNYNNYFIFTITAIEKEKGGENFNSLLMIFGYANGTDEEIDISPYLSDSDSYDPDINLITKLLENITIDNNIFGYEIVNKIKLVYIPEEIKFYNEEIEQELQNDDILELNYKIKQNKDLIKDYNYYKLEYQFIVKEPDYSTLYNDAPQILDSEGDLSNYYTSQVFYGRTNTLNSSYVTDFAVLVKLMVFRTMIKNVYLVYLNINMIIIIYL